MRLLLDTHIFLWFISGDSKLSISAQAHIADPNVAERVQLVEDIWDSIVQIPEAVPLVWRGARIRSLTSALSALIVKW